MTNTFYSMTSEATLAALNASTNGLTTNEALQRTKTYGFNEIPRKAAIPYVQR